MAAAILQEKAPYLVTILFAATGWVVTYAVDQVDKAPTIEYTIRHEPDELLVDLHNITRTVSFEGLQFTLGFKGQGKWKNGYFANRSGPEWDGNHAISFYGGTLPFTIDNFQPGWTFTLVGVYEGPAETRFYLSDSNHKVVNLTEPNAGTFFVDHELPILFSLLLVWSFVTGILLWRAA